MRLKICIENNTFILKDVETGQPVSGVLNANINCNLQGVSATITLVDFDVDADFDALVKRMMYYSPAVSIFTPIDIANGQRSEFPLDILSLKSPSAKAYFYDFDKPRRDKRGEKKGWINVHTFEQGSMGATALESEDAYKEKTEKKAADLLLKAGRGNKPFEEASIETLLSLFKAKMCRSRSGRENLKAFVHDGYLVGVDMSHPDVFVMPTVGSPQTHPNTSDSSYYTYGEFGLGVLDGSKVLCGPIRVEK